MMLNENEVAILWACVLQRQVPQGEWARHVRVEDLLAPFVLAGGVCREAHVNVGKDDLLYMKTLWDWMAGRGPVGAVVRHMDPLRQKLEAAIVEAGKDGKASA